jgi:plasmid maintenance system antidote protein VapI
MKEIEKNNINTFITQHRNKLDEALVSLRFMKEIDLFLDQNEISQREFAEFLGYSESFISQLMSGTKKVNTSFINRLEKTFDVSVKFNIIEKNRSDYFVKFYDSSIAVNIDAQQMNSTKKIYTIFLDDEQVYNPFLEV